MCAKSVRNLQPFMEDQICLKGYTASLCCGSCRKERSKTKMVRNDFSNKIKITCNIHESLYFLPHKNHHESLSASRILLFHLMITQTRLIHHSNLCSSCIGPGPSALLRIAGFLPKLCLFVAFSFTIGVKDPFSAAVSMRRADNKSVTLLKLSRSGRCRTRTRWQGLFGLTILVRSELLRKGNQIMLCFWHV